MCVTFGQLTLSFLFFMCIVYSSIRILIVIFCEHIAVVLDKLYLYKAAFCCICRLKYRDYIIAFSVEGSWEVINLWKQSVWLPFIFSVSRTPMNILCFLKITGLVTVNILVSVYTTDAYILFSLHVWEKVRQCHFFNLSLMSICVYLPICWYSYKNNSIYIQQVILHK